MQYETTLKFNSNDFRNFYENWIAKSRLLMAKSLRKYLIIGIILLIISGLMFASMNSNNRFIIWLLLGFASYFLFKVILTNRRFNRNIAKLREELTKYLKRHENTESFGLKIDEKKIQYFENGQFYTAYAWSDLTNVDIYDDHFMLYFGEQPDNILIPRFGVSKEFYNGVLELTGSKRNVK